MPKSARQSDVLGGVANVGMLSSSMCQGRNAPAVCAGVVFAACGALILSMHSTALLSAVQQGYLLIGVLPYLFVFARCWERCLLSRRFSFQIVVGTDHNSALVTERCGPLRRASCVTVSVL